MQKIKPGSRVVYATEEGGLNAIVTKVFSDEAESVGLIFVDGEGKVHEVQKTPNVHHATEDIERKVMTKTGERTEKGPGLKRFDYWRR